MPTDWNELAASSPYQTAVAVDQAIRRGDLDEAGAGLRELIDALSRSERRALRAQLIRLMVHVLKWRAQPERRSRSWSATIANARDEIDEIRDETPSLTRATIEAMWDRCLAAALRDAGAEVGRDLAVDRLDWRDVFEAEYPNP